MQRERAQERAMAKHSLSHGLKQEPPLVAPVVGRGELECLVALQNVARLPLGIFDKEVGRGAGLLP